MLYYVFISESLAGIIGNCIYYSNPPNNFTGTADYEHSCTIFAPKKYDMWSIPGEAITAGHGAIKIVMPDNPFSMFL